MSAYETKFVFAHNLNRFLAKTNQTQIDLARALGVSKSTVSSWCTGEKMPRMDKIEMLAQHFSVNKSALLDAAAGEEAALDEYERALLREVAELNKSNKQKLIEMALFFRQLQDNEPLV